MKRSTVLLWLLFTGSAAAQTRGPLDLANAPDWTKIKSPFCPPQIGATP